MELKNKFEGIRLAEIQKRILEGDNPKLHEYPYFELTVKIYAKNLIPLPDGSKRGTTEFKTAGYDIFTNDDIPLGAISSGVGTGNMFLSFEGLDGAYVISSSEVWSQVADVLGVVIPEEEETNE